MPAINKMKTYGRPNKSIVNNSWDARNLLQINKARQRKKPKFFIKELPARTIGETLLGHDSFHVSTEDTFDKLVKGGACNPIAIKSHISIVNNSDSDASKSLKRVNSFYSPIMTRRRKYVASIMEISSTSDVGVSKNKSDISKSAKKEEYIYSPMMTRSRKKPAYTAKVSDSSYNANGKNKSDSAIPHFKEPTVEKIDFSLEVEMVRNQAPKSLSYIVIPEVKAGELSIGGPRNNTTKCDLSFDPIFTKTFREKQLIHSSTPLVPMKSKKIVNYTISPIRNVNQSESSVGKENSGQTSKVATFRHSTLEFTNDEYVREDDWKLAADPKIMISLCPQIETQSVASHPGFKGREIFQSKLAPEQFQKVVGHKENLNFICNVKSPKVQRNNVSRQSFITLRKRRVLKNSFLQSNKSRKRSGNSRAITETVDRSQTRMKSVTLEDSSAFVEKVSGGKASNCFSKLITLQDFNDFVEKSSRGNLPELLPRTVSAYSLSNFELFESQHKELLSSKDFTDTASEAKGCQTDVSRSFVNKRRRRLTDSYLITHKKPKTVDGKSSKEKSVRRRSFQEESRAEYLEAALQDVVVLLPKIKYVSRGHSANTLSNRGSTTSSDSDQTSVTHFSDTSTNGSSEVSENDFFRLKHPVFKDFAVDLTRLEPQPSSLCGIDSSVQSLPDKSKSLFECYSINSNNGDTDRSASVACQTLRDDLTKTPPHEKGTALISNDNFEQFYERVTQRSRSCNEHTEVRRSSSGELSVVDTTSFQDDFVDENLRHRDLIVNLTKSPWRRNGKQGVLSSKSSADSSVVDLTDSFEAKDVRRSDAVNDILMLKEEQFSKHSISDIIESSMLESSQVDGDGFKVPVFNNVRKRHSKTLLLKAGKLWRRSLSMYKRSSIMLSAFDMNVCRLPDGKFCLCPKCSLAKQCSRLSSRRNSIRIVPAKPAGDSQREISILENYAHNASYVSDRILDDNLENDLRSLSLSKRKNSLVQNSAPVTARELVLKRCEQEEPLPFEECYPKSLLQNCQKIGEGVYGEVFLFRNPNGGTSVMKVIPIEGDLMVNGERQKKFEEILSEITIALELSSLRNKKNNKTSGFSEVQKVSCVQGRYPEKLTDLWELYDETRGSENDSPEIFGDDQLYIILQLANGGSDLEAFIFSNSLQSYCMFQQVACALAVAEEELSFEHRDLHWGNVLLSTVDKNSKVAFRLDGKNYDIMTKGVEVAIIDFTLSRIECDGVVIFNDLSLDPDLFTAEGDYQFEVYKLMQKKNGDNWQRFEPHTNILWLHYVLDKAFTALRYKNTQTKVHKEYLGKLKHFKEEILNYDSVKEFVSENF